MSSDKQAEKGLSLAAQKKAGIEAATRANCTYQIYEDAGRSADKESIENRPALSSLLEEVEEGKFQRVFATEIDRLARNPATLAYIKKILQDNNVELITQTQTFNFAEDDDDFISDLLGLLAKRENRVRVKRSKRGMLQAALQGKWHGGIVPFGYAVIKNPLDPSRHNKLIPDPDESAIYQNVVEWCLEGLGTREIARRLNAQGIPTKGSKLYRSEIRLKVKGRNEWRVKNTHELCWKAGTVYGILRNPLYKGTMHYLGNKVNVPALIDEQKWNRVQSQLKANFNNARRNTKRFYLLRGLLWCDRCGRRLYGLIKPGRHMRLYCCLSKRPDPEPRFCGLKNVNLDRLNDLVWNTVRDLVTNSSKLMAAIRQEQATSEVNLSDLRRELAALVRAREDKKTELQRIVKLYGQSKILSLEDLDEQLALLKAELEAMDAERSRLEKAVNGNAASKDRVFELVNWTNAIKTRIDKFTDIERHQFLQLVIDKIVVSFREGVGHEIDILGAIPLDDTPQESWNSVSQSVSNCDGAASLMV